VKWLRNVGLYLGHLLTALIGTAFFTTAISRLHHPTTVLQALWQETIVGFICAGLLGFAASKISSARLALWVWLAVAPFFMFHVLSTLFHGSQISVLTKNEDLWSRIFGFDCLAEHYVGRCLDFFEFTVPMDRTAAYSLGAGRRFSHIQLGSER
jgi:hypothetical protein